LEAARWAPSNHNRQPWRFLILEDRAEIQRLAGSVRAALETKLRVLPEAAAAYATVFEQAPVLIVALHKRPISASAALLADVPNGELVSGEPLSVAMAVENMLLAAHALGLGACVLTAPLLVPEAIGCVVPLPPGFDLTCFVALGYPAESPLAPRRKNLEHFVEYISKQTQS
jgi:nitroreductase